MKILYLTSTFHPSTNGVAVCVKTTMETLLQKGHEVTVLAPDNSSVKDDSKNVIRYSSVTNPLNTDYPLPIVPINSKIIDLLLNTKYDIVHAHHPFHIAWFADTYAKRYKVPFVFTYHTKYLMYADIYLKFLSKKLRTNIVNFGTDYACKSADLVFAPSTAIKTELINKFPYINVETMPTGVKFPNNITNENNYLRNKLQLDNETKILLSLSRVSKEKNIQLSIESLKNLPTQYHLVIVGSGPDEGNLKQYADNRGVSNRVTFFGRVPHEDVPNLMNSSDIFVSPSITETQGLGLLEAMSFGLPVVSVKTEVSTEWVPFSIGMVTENDSRDFAEGILKVSKNYDENKKCEIKEYASSFTLEKTTDLLLEKYQDVINRKALTIALNNTGWQSWSIDTKPVLKIPARNYPPQRDTYLAPAIQESEEKTNKITGWCSWYAYFDRISEEVIKNQAEFIYKNQEHIPLEYVIVDDGWTKWGDWRSVNSLKFPHGLKQLASEISERNLKPGIWLAPFLVEKDSDTFRDHRDWLVSYQGILSEGFKVTPLLDRLWKYKRYILDIKQQGVREYLYESIHTLIETYGFKLLKLDFLYAPYFDRNLDTKEAGYLIHHFLEELKMRYPDVHINACGIPLVTALGVSDSVRIGPDTVAPYLDGLPLISCYINSLKVEWAVNTINKRHWTSKFWINDPDVFVCRKSLGLSDDIIMRLQNTIIKTNGNILLGDDLTELSDQDYKKYIYPLFAKSDEKITDKLILRPAEVSNV